MWSPLWSILVCKIPQFLAKSYQFRQLVILFQKVDTLRLLKIYIMFCPFAGAKYPFFQAPAHGLICLFTVSFLAKRFLKQFSQVSISPFGGLQIVIRIIFLHFLFKIYMLRDSTASEFMPKSCRLLKDSDSCTNILIPLPLRFFLI